VALLGAAQFAGAQVVTNWAAYNDYVPSATTHPNANIYNLRGVAGTPPEPTEGFLKDFASGDQTPAYIIATATGAPDYFGGIAYPNAGTPAYNLFNGIVDLGNVNSAIGIRSSANTTVTLTFSNLNPAQRYIFRGTTVRGNNYPRRWTLASLRGADSFTDAHTAAVYTSANFPTGTMTNGQAAYNSGENRAEGALIGWDNINPGADGVITIKNEQYVDSPLPNGQTPDLTTYGYAFAGIYLAEVGSPTPATITANPPANVTLEQNRPLTLFANAQGAPAPALQWYKNNAPISGANARTFSIALAQPGDSGDYYLVASNSLNQATSTVSRVTVFADTNGPVLLSVKADDTFQKIFLVWNETITLSPATELGSYLINDPMGNSVFVSSVDFFGTGVVLHVPTMLANTNYSIEIDYQTDLVLNPTKPVGNPVGDGNGIVTNFHTFTFTRGFTRFQAYLGRPPAETLAQFIALPIYPDGDSFSFYTNVLNWPQSAPNVEQYVMRFTGIFVAPESGTHRFDPAHDDDVLLRIYTTPDPSGASNEFSAVCCTGLTGGPTLDVDLAAGQRYYYELLVREFGGGDYAGIGVTLPSGAVSAPIAAQYLALAADAAAAPNMGISQQPQNQTVQVNHGATFSVVVTNGGAGVSYQWQLDAGSGFGDVTNGNGASYTTPLLQFADSGHQYRVVVSAPGRSITSSAATVSVVNDTNAPHITSVSGGGTLITVFFDEVMDAGAIGDTSNYELKDSNSVVLALSSPVVAGDSRSVTFTTPAQNLGALYTLHAEFVPDPVGNPLVPTNIVFRSGRGFVKFEAYDTSSTAGNAVSLLTAHPSYPNSPRDVALIPTFDSRNTYPDDTHEQYGGRISGWYVPPATGNYIFYLRSDDASELWLSTDNNPANRVKIQEELGCCNAFSVHPSAPKALVGGQAYYIDVLWKEGTGGDFGQAAVKNVNDPTPPDSLLPISGAFLSAVDPAVTPPAPRLTFLRLANGDLTLSWSAGARLQCTASLTPPVVWKDIDTAGATTYTVSRSNEFSINLDTAQEPAPRGTGSGRGTLTLSNNVLVVDVTYSGLSGNRNNSHFHAPGLRGQNVGIAYSTALIDSATGANTNAGTIRGTIPLADNAYGGKNIAAQLQDLRGGLWYLNVHSTAFPGGEIRGQVDPPVRFYRLISP
jgi:hypothetical protein